MLLKNKKQEQDKSFDVFKDKEMVKARDVKDWMHVINLFYAPTKDGAKLVIESESIFVFAPSQFEKLVAETMEENGLVNPKDVIDTDDLYIKFEVIKMKNGNNFINVIFR